MAHSNSTQYYNLPQFDSTDKPAWLVDVNPAYASIDAGIHAAKVAADDAQGDATQALTDAASAGTAASGADAKASGSIASIADTFDPTATYNEGDLVIYNNLLYICIVDVTVPGAWTGSGNWNRTTIENEINKKQGTLTEGDGIDITGDTVSVDISSLDPVASLSGSDIVPVSSNGALKSATVEDVVNVGFVSENIKTNWVTLSSSNLSIVDSLITKVGNMVFVSINIKSTTNYDTTSQFTIGTVASDYRPFDSINTFGMSSASQWGSDPFYPCYCYLGTNGALTAKVNGSNQKFIKMNFAYSL